MVGGIAISRRSFFAVVCVVALVGILVSPAVPSPPTIVGKAIHASVTSLMIAVLPPACALASAVLGMLYPATEYVVQGGDSAVGAVFLPLRR